MPVISLNPMKYLTVLALVILMCMTSACKSSKSKLMSDNGSSAKSRADDSSRPDAKTAKSKNAKQATQGITKKPVSGKKAKPPAKNPKVQSKPIPAKLVNVRLSLCIATAGTNQGIRKGGTYEILVDGKVIGKLVINSVNPTAAGCRMMDLSQRPVSGQMVHLRAVDR